MKNFVKSMLAICLICVATSCRKDDMPETESNCYICSVEAVNVDVCIKDDGDFLVDGETVPNPDNASLRQYVDAIEENPNNDPALDGISCRLN